jgi:hypothetical protein
LKEHKKLAVGSWQKEVGKRQKAVGKKAVGKNQVAKSEL